MSYKLSGDNIVVFDTFKVDTASNYFSLLKKRQFSKIVVEKDCTYDSSIFPLLIYAKSLNIEIDVSQSLKNELLQFQEVSSYQTDNVSKKSWLEKFAESFDNFFVEIFNFAVLSGDTLYYSIRGLFTRDGRKDGAVFEQVELIGRKAIPIITLLSFLIGLILSLQSAAQLKQFGANIFLVDLIVISMISEMGPMITAIIVAGRSGSAISAEIATMKITEELDALSVMALNPLKYVVAPRIIGITISLPLLTTAANLIGIAGGFIVAVLYLDLNGDIFIERALSVMTIRTWLISLFKSFVFAILIGLIGVFYGFNVKGGAEGVGRSTTASVVAAIFSVILSDALLSLIFYFKF
ncbi:MAG: ABC transporter [Candidatus Cloacimonadota bacterium]|nr:MAG: ABC transporter [Candidatus Cloacimonadota bacterium]PIE79061.1 MAG: ABC transporter [Candidatus Delongbacteria bacterium]